MNCKEITDLKDAYLDGELDPITSQKIERHLRDCSNCGQVYEMNSALTHAISRGAPYYKAPIELSEGIRSSLRNASDGAFTSGRLQETQLPATSTQRESRDVISNLPWNWLALAAGIVLVAIIASSFFSRMSAPTSAQFLATQLIASHVRSLMANHLTDVGSSDQHTVKPWLDTKLDFAPPVVDLSSEGFPLVGGRLDYLDNRPVAALVYGRRKHFINLFVWPAASHEAKAPKTITREGYQLLHWADSDFNYWAVSDVNLNDLQLFKQQFQTQTARR